MSNDKKNEFAGELLPPEVIRKGVYELGNVDRVPPAVGIFDSPTRCFVVNVEWWSHIAGMVHLLADVVSWKDADDESYFAITEILKFMQGMDCMDFALRQNPADSCIMQQTLDGGATWTDVFDFSQCVTIQDKSYQVQIQNQVTYVQPTFQEIYNNFVANYTGSPGSVYPDLSPPTGDASALSAAYCNAIFETVKAACNAAVAWYTDSVNQAQNEINVGLGIAAFMLAAISIAGAIPTAGASLAGLAPAAGLWAAGIALGGVLAQSLVDHWQAHTIDQFQDTEAMEEVTCYLVDEVAATDGSLASIQAALASHTLTGNAAAIADSLAIMLQNDGLYAAFLEKWNNNKQYADAGIDMYCPCASEYRVWVWDFANGLGDFSIVNGSLSGGRIVGEDVGTRDEVELTMPFDPTWKVVGGAYYGERVSGDLSSACNDAFLLRPTPNSNSGSSPIVNGVGIANGITERCHMFLPFEVTGINQLVLFAQINEAGTLYVDKVKLVFLPDFAKGGYITDDDDICS